MTHNMASSFSAVLFDLDGTLLDTAPALVNTLNQMLDAYQRPQAKLADLRPYISYGARQLLTLGFNNDFPKALETLRDEFLAHYQTQCTQANQYFVGIEDLLTRLNETATPWAIVTNKPTAPTMAIIETMPLLQTAKTIVCGDTLAVAKPDPAPLLLACEQMAIVASQAVYIGDCDRDIMAGKAAAMQTIACAYGYVEPSAVNDWGATHIVNMPSDLHNLIF